MIYEHKMKGYSTSYHRMVMTPEESTKFKEKVTRQNTVPEKEPEEFAGNISLSYVKGTSEKLIRILHTHKIRCSFY